jgi:hypothetical protein
MNNHDYRRKRTRDNESCRCLNFTRSSLDDVLSVLMKFMPNKQTNTASFESTVLYAMSLSPSYYRTLSQKNSGNPLFRTFLAVT